MMKYFFSLFLNFMAAAAFGQALPISIDGGFDDWTSAAVQKEDATGDGNGLDFLRFFVANDDDFLFLRLQLAQEINLTENNEAQLFLDTDANVSTGKQVNGIGAELEIRLGERFVIFYLQNGNEFLYLNDVAFHSQPTVSSTDFEIAIGRDVLPDGIHPLFTGNQVRIFFRDGLAGDQMPGQGEVFSYAFDPIAVPPLMPVVLDKNNPEHLRLLTWNTLEDGLDDLIRKPAFKRVFAALQPDIVTFNECWDMTAGQVAAFMNSTLPLANGQNWNAIKLDQGNVTVSRFPILQNWYFYPGHRLTASLIDLPDALYPKDILVVNAHLKCCTDNPNRQKEADAFVSFIRDAKTPGGVINLPSGTPFVLSGDLNLVGFRQQLTTLLTGDIVNNGQFGADSPMDWDGADLQDVIALQADLRMAYTWREEGSEYPPSRLDFHILTGSVLSVEKDFTLQTEMMPQARLDEYGLLKNDTRTASDHFPKVTDVRFKTATVSTEGSNASFSMKISPNPSSGQIRVECPAGMMGTFDVFLKKTDGSVVLKMVVATNEKGVFDLDMSAFPDGVYFLEMKGGGKTGVQKLIIWR